MFNSVNSFLGDRHTIITEPQMLMLDDCDICFLPYVVECERKPLESYFPANPVKNKPRIILSHNDISGIQLGPVVSKTGFTCEEIESTCDLFINGHLHNGQWLSEKIVNLGNLTGKDFGEDAFKHTHNVAILDTQTMSLSFIENPHAYNFYKIQIDTEKDFSVFDTLKPNAVLSIKCDSTMLLKTKQRLEELTDKIQESRIIIINKSSEVIEENDTIDLTVDHLARFIECCKANIENTELLTEEINEVCK